MNALGTVLTSGIPAYPRTNAAFHARVFLAGETVAVLDTGVFTVPVLEEVDASLEVAFVELRPLRSCGGQGCNEWSENKKFHGEY